MGDLRMTSGKQNMIRSNIIQILSRQSLIYSLCIDLGARGHWGHVPPRFCNEQRITLFIFRKCPHFLKENGPSKCRAPKFEMLSYVPVAVPQEFVEAKRLRFWFAGVDANLNFQDGYVCYQSTNANN